jgi:type IV pilus assembly protein PilP
VLLLACAVFSVACEDPIIMGTGTTTTADGNSAKGAPTPSAQADAKQKLQVAEADFVESERSRDPFRGYTGLLIEETAERVRSQREVILNEYSVDELKLVGIVTRVEPRAMLIDPTGKGHVVRRGQFVGRSDVVQAGGQAGAAYEINWRIDRIRDGDVVLVREDPKNRDVPTATKVLPLRPEGSIVITQ